MTEYAIEVNDVTMRYNLAREKVDSLKEYFVRNIKKNNQRDEFYAVKNVSFKIEKGDSFAIVGSNGSGKSTLLKMIAGIYKPTQGNIIVRGTIAPMIELGAGFDSDLTAAENVFLNGAVLGYSRAYMKQYYEGIIDFAELWEFVDVPVKNYSSGMKARLGFSIATAVQPDILIVDEILSVGDANFRKKCEQRMGEMKDRGTTMILVSHSMEQVLKTCNKAMWINKGDMMCIGDVEEVQKYYSASI
ncbi:ABC transporter ATP-binding protein [Anoxybacterium hadale]|uniref:ABC transporter ATP-binding protein n=1 Tax=Anoxybacterium hadale TaxID=3408580 RepID=A0ACD1AF15_9FIRM|nr:ABC transporter ATP-binding protein [Clostridiales bacterium]